MSSARLEIRVQPKASRNKVVVNGDIIKVYVTTAPEDGKANKAVVDLLAKHLDLSKRAIKIVSGAKSRTKVIAVEGIDEGEARRRVDLQQSQ